MVSAWASFFRAPTRRVYLLASPLLQQYQQNQAFTNGGRKHEKKPGLQKEDLKRKKERKNKKEQHADHQKVEYFSRPTQEHELPGKYFKATSCLI